MEDKEVVLGARKVFMEMNVREHMLALLNGLPAAITEDAEEIAVRQARMEKNKELLSYVRATMNAYGGAKTSRDYVLDAIEKRPVGVFSSEELAKDIKEQFPDTDVSPREVSTQLYRMWSRGRAKTFRQATKGGGRTGATYEKIQPVRNRTRNAAMDRSNELLPANGSEEK